jgi:hypothetical protein
MSRQCPDDVRRLDEYFKAASETSTSMKTSPDVISRSVNPFVTRHGAELFQFYNHDKTRGARFASAMAGISKGMYAFFVTSKTKVNYSLSYSGRATGGP